MNHQEAEVVLEAIRTRRSIRRYRPDPVPQALLDQIVEAGLYAASGMNRQSAAILPVSDRELRDRLSRMNAAVMGRVGDDPFYGAPAVLVVLARREVPTHVYDGSLVMGNMMLAAHVLGLGSCWIHRAREEFDSEEGKALLRELGVEGDWEGIGHLIVGYPDGELPQARERAQGRVLPTKH